MQFNLSQCTFDVSIGKLHIEGLQQGEFACTSLQKSEAIDTDKSVALMVAKMTTDTESQ